METIFLSLGDNLDDPVTGESRTDAHKHRRLVRQAAEAEAAGFDVFALGEHHFNHFVFSAPEVALAAIAQGTDRIRLGTGVTLITTLDPVAVAERFSTLDLMSDGRADIVVGRGAYGQIFQAMGRPQEQATDIYEESVELLWRLLNEEDLSWNGRWRPPLEGITIRPRPHQQPIPLWSSSTTALELPARLGLGLEWVAALHPFPALAPFAEKARAAWERHSRPRDTWKLRLGVHYHVARTSQEARQAFTPYHTNYVSGNAGLSVANYRRDYSMDIDRNQILIHPSGDIIPFCGSPAEVVDKIGHARDLLGITGIAMAIDMGGMPDDMVLRQIELTGTDVLPALAELADPMTMSDGESVETHSATA